MNAYHHSVACMNSSDNSMVFYREEAVVKDPVQEGAGSRDHCSGKVKNADERQ